MTSGRKQWVAIELDFADHPKMLKVGAAGGWAHLRAILYAARYRTDGFIPQEAVWRILNDDPMMEEEANEGLEASMVEAGLWHPVANGYQIHDYLEHQANAETIREKRRRAGRMGGLAKAKQTASTTRQNKLDVDVDVDKTPTPYPAVDVGEPNGREPLPDFERVLKDMPL